MRIVQFYLAYTAYLIKYNHCCFVNIVFNVPMCLVHSKYRGCILGLISDELLCKCHTYYYL